MTVSKAEHEVLHSRYEALQQQNTQLRHELEQLKRLIFSAKSERFVPTCAPEQMALWDQGGEAGAQTVEKEQISYERKKKKAHPGRTKLPDNLPVEIIPIAPAEDTTGMVKIGEEQTDELEYRPGVMYIRRYVRAKYARAQEVEGQPAVIIGELPERPIPRGIPGKGLLAQLIVAKYVDHLPFYRQIEQFKRNHGVVFHKSSINNWFAACCTLLDPLYAALQKNVLTTDYLQGDESRIEVLDREKAKNTHRGWMWVFHNPQSGNALFVYRGGRGANVLHETLNDFTGLLQTDGYSAYTSFVKNRQVELVSCLAHIRRKFFEAKDNHRQVAEMALAAMGYLYRIEARCRQNTYTPAQRLKMRRRLARPAYDALLEWVGYHHRNNLKSGAIGKALKYAADHLPRLAHYLSDGRVEIDNNLIENKIRPLALGRKNYLFAGSHEGGRRAAMMYSFLASCKANDINPQAWLADVLGRIGSHPVNRLEELLPAQWGKSCAGKT